jgi:hypothetical protein
MKTIFGLLCLIPALVFGQAKAGGSSTARNVTALSPNAITYTSAVANSGTNVAHILNTTLTLSGTTSLACFRNNTTDKFCIADDGTITPGSFNGAQIGTGALPFNAAVISQYLDTSGNLRLQVTGTGNVYAGNVANSAGVIANYAGNITTLTNATARIFSFFSDNNITGEMAAVLASGMYAPQSTDSSGTPGAATINKPSGRVAVAATAASVVVTNSLVTTATHPIVTITEADATCTSVLRAVPTAGTLTVTLNAVCTTDTTVDFYLVQPLP